MRVWISLFTNYTKHRYILIHMYISHVQPPLKEWQSWKSFLYNSNYYLKIGPYIFSILKCSLFFSGRIYMQFMKHILSYFNTLNTVFSIISHYMVLFQFQNYTKKKELLQRKGVCKWSSMVAVAQLYGNRIDIQTNFMTFGHVFDSI